MLRNGYPKHLDTGSDKTMRGMADWLCFAASPVFAVMALVAQGDGHADMFCSAVMNASPLGGMVPMYLLMSLFHSTPWWKLVFGPRHRSASS